VRTQQQETAGKIITAALAAEMLYVPPVKYEIPKGYVCTRCGKLLEHGVDCLPPFGLKVSV
jgi:hypothetical protein